MSCGKAREIDLAAYLVDPDLPEWTEFREHYPTCPECADEVAAWSRIEASLRSAGDPDQGAHPAAELLARFEDDPRSLSAADWQRVDQHTRECRQCADELAALREFDFSALEGRAPATIGEAARAMGRAASELLRTLAQRAVPGRGEEPLPDLSGALEPDLVFLSGGGAAAEPVSRGEAPLAVLAALTGEAAGNVFAIVPGENRIGRAKECEVRILAASLSRVEASISAQPDALRITALHEGRPVLVNGEVVSSGPLHDGDQVQIGEDCYQIRRIAPR
jgi:anti-sigma factor RsiW